MRGRYRNIWGESVTSEINDALVGAEQIHEMLHNAIRLGDQNLKNNCYQIKSRVKDKRSLRRKISEKISSGRENYSAKDVTDLVGFRFITLFQHELLYLVEIFVDFLEDFQKKPINLFWGEGLLDCVKEVIVYQSSVNETVYVSIYEFLQGRLSSRGFPIDFVKLQRKDSLYSSVHMIVYGNILIGGEVKTIPIEFQLRTAFEDVWGEMQHQLLYKNPHVDIKTREGMDLYNEGNELLKILKDNLDSCSNHARFAYVKLVAGTNSAVEPAKRAVSANLASILEGFEDALGAASVGEVQRLRSCVSAGYEAVRDGALNADAHGVEQLFKRALDELDHFDKKWLSSYSVEEQAYALLRYGMDMERAAANYWIGEALFRQATKKDRDALSSSDLFFEAARQIYFGLTKFSDFAYDPVLNFRIAQIYRKLSRSDLAIEYYRAALESSKRENWRDKGSVFEILIPRHLAYMIWSTAEFSLRSHTGLHSFEAALLPQPLDDPIAQKYKKALLEAFSLTKDIEKVDIVKVTPDLVDIDQEKAIAFNNSLWYAVEYIDTTSGDNNEEMDGFTNEYYLKLFSFKYFSEISSLQVMILETFLKAAMHFSDRANGKAWLDELSKRIDTDEWNSLESWIRNRILMTVDRARRWLE